MSKTISINNADIILNTSDIQDIKACELSKKDGEGDMYLLRVYTKKPEINIYFNSLSDAQKLYKDLNKTLDVVDIRTQRRN